MQAKHKNVKCQKEELLDFEGKDGLSGEVGWVPNRGDGCDGREHLWAGL